MAGAEACGLRHIPLTIQDLPTGLVRARAEPLRRARVRGVSPGTTSNAKPRGRVDHPVDGSAAPPPDRVRCATHSR